MFEMEKAVKYDGLVVIVGMPMPLQVSTKKRLACVKSQKRSL